MSGWDAEKGVFQLTSTKESYWLRRKDFPEGTYSINQLGHIDYDIEKLFLFFGIRAVSHGNYTDVFATPEKVWEVLSGQPSNPERAAHYY
jgi:hypothetical protein